MPEAGGTFSSSATSRTYRGSDPRSRRGELAADGGRRPDADQILAGDLDRGRVVVGLPLRFGQLARRGATGLLLRVDRLGLDGRGDQVGDPAPPRLRNRVAARLAGLADEDFALQRQQRLARLEGAAGGEAHLGQERRAGGQGAEAVVVALGVGGGQGPLDANPAGVVPDREAIGLGRLIVRLALGLHGIAAPVEVVLIGPRVVGHEQEDRDPGGAGVGAEVGEGVVHAPGAQQAARFDEDGLDVGGLGREAEPLVAPIDGLRLVAEALGEVRDAVAPVDVAVDDDGAGARGVAHEPGERRHDPAGAGEGTRGLQFHERPGRRELGATVGRGERLDQRRGATACGQRLAIDDLPEPRCRRRREVRLAVGDRLAQDLPQHGGAGGQGGREGPRRVVGGEAAGARLRDGPPEGQAHEGRPAPSVGRVDREGLAREAKAEDALGLADGDGAGRRGVAAPLPVLDGIAGELDGVDQVLAAPRRPGRAGVRVCAA